MNVVLYMRYSSDRQTEQSIEGQRRVCTAFCAQQGYNIVGSYVDRATSAFKDTDKRTEFQRMIRDSEKQQWDAIVVYKLDRFARNRYDSATYKAKLKKNGVRLISATENISENPEGVILEAVLEGMAEFYSKELSQKITRGMNETALKCNSTGGHIPLGYKIENKKMVVDPLTAPIVQEAFELYANGTSVADICNLFNNKGYRTAKGALFNKNSFRTMFKNERYIGIYKYKDIKVEGGMPAIIDKEIFDKVQIRLKSVHSAPARGKAKVDYILTQKLFCGHCGAMMIGDSGTGRHNVVYNYYTCSTRKNHSACDKKPLRKEFIERVVAEDAMSLLTPEMVDALAEAAVKQNKLDIQNDTLIPSLETELREINKGINNLIKLAEKGIISDTVTDRLQQLEREKRVVERRLVEASDDIIILEKEHIVWWLTRFLDGDINDEEYRRSLIDLFVNSVTVWDEPDGEFRITTMYNLTDRPSKTAKISPDGSVLGLSGAPKKAVQIYLCCFLFFMHGLEPVRVLPSEKQCGTLFLGKRA